MPPAFLYRSIRWLRFITHPRGVAAMKTSRDYRARQTLAWVRAGQMGLNARIQGEQRLETLGDNVLHYLADYLQAQIGTIFVSESEITCGA